jgi:hypothetical protein
MLEVLGIIEAMARVGVGVTKLVKELTEPLSPPLPQNEEINRRMQERENLINETKTRKCLASKDDTYVFRANFEEVEDINWDMFKNE